MAPGTGHLCGIAAVAAALVLVVAGCGGSSPASGTTSTSTSSGSVTATTSAAEEQAVGGADPKGSAGSEKSDAGQVPGRESDRGARANGHKKKNPPLELPEGKPEEVPSKTQQANVPTAAVELSLPEAPVVNGQPGVLPAANTCDGKDVAPEVRWGKLPDGIAEVALFVMNLQPVNGKLYFDYAIAGIDPSQEGLRPGEVPKGAVIGRNSAGKAEYSLCPKGTASEEFIVAMYAISKDLSPKKGFEPLALRKKATPLSPVNGIYAVVYPAE